MERTIPKIAECAAAVVRNHGADFWRRQLAARTDTAGLVMIPTINRTVCVAPDGLNPDRVVIRRGHYWRCSLPQVEEVRSSHRQRVSGRRVHAESAVHPDTRAVAIDNRHRVRKLWGRLYPNDLASQGA